VLDAIDDAIMKVLNHEDPDCLKGNFALHEDEPKLKVGKVGTPKLT